MVQKKRLGEIALLQRGLTYSKGDEVPSSSKVVLRSNNIDLESHSLDLSELKFLREDFVIPEDRRVKKDSIFICMSNGSKQHVGKVAFIDRDMDYAFGGFMGLIVPKPSVSAKYVFYACNSSSYRTFLSQIGNGIGITNLRFSDLEKFEIPLPSIEDQQRIVDELDLLTGIIDKKSAQLRDFDNLAKSLFFDLFGNPFINEKNWDIKPVGDCFLSIKNGANIKQTKGASGLPITRIETLSNGVFNRDRLGYADLFDVNKYNSFVLNDGDILMSHINSKAYIGCSVVYKAIPGECIIHGMNLLRLIGIDSIIRPDYAKHFFDTDFFKKQVASIRKDAVNQSSMAVGDLKKLSILIPPIDIQDKFVERLSAIEKQKALLISSMRDFKYLLNSRLEKWFI